jgi:PleD family two-component response regulator
VILPALGTALVAPEEVFVPFPAGHERVLVVDDEPDLAMAMKQIIERLGYAVEHRSDGIEALQALRHQTRDKPFDLLITAYDYAPYGRC